MSKNDREDKIQVNFQLPRSKWESFQVKCKDNGTSISEVLHLLVELYLAEEIGNSQNILSVGLSTKIDAEIGKYIGNKLDGYIDKYIEKKLIKGIKRIDDTEELVTTKNKNKLVTVENKSEIFRDKYQDKKILIKEVFDKREVKNNQSNDKNKNLKTARELA